ncbi:Fe/S biogenesis protein NfuA [Commensalibacter sp. Nvir]|uniref:NifU family protein n=1 Tax=Commensalibacter sp. Nvir TaxID=3069817 RepID=UPI002D3D250C|nr:Fe/S biogenesis protein NfuA [Commensalibacter sp. Nvir]
MIIRTEDTPNPNALKLSLDRKILEEHQTVGFNSKGSAFYSPLASALFDLPGVERVFFGTEFLVVIKSAECSWDNLKTDIVTIVMDFISTGKSFLNREMNGSASGFVMEVAPEDEEIVKKIKTLLDNEIRPAVAQDGGDIVFHGYRDGSVYLRMQGACRGCPSSSLTLKHGVETILRRHLPQIISVEKVEL